MDQYISANDVIVEVQDDGDYPMEEDEDEVTRMISRADLLLALCFPRRTLFRVFSS
jgi:hypothetical protein